MTIRQCSLCGFSAFEVLTLESFFKLAGRRPPGYAVTHRLDEAHVLIVNGEDGTTVQDLARRYPNVEGIVIGQSAHGTRWTVMPRPIRLLSVLEEMERLLSAHASAAPATLQPAVDTSHPQATSAAALADQPTSATASRRSRSLGRSVFGDSVGFAASPVTQSHEDAQADDDFILVVDDSETVLRFMQGRLRRFGYSVALAHSGEQAIEMVKQRPYKFVFLDVMMPGIDGYATCRAIKAEKTGQASPVVIMLSSKGGSIDKLRGRLAGAEAYLTKPLAEAELVKVLADHDQGHADQFSDTRPQTRASISWMMRK